MLIVLADDVFVHRWAGIFFSPYSVLYPLNNLCLRPCLHRILMQAGLLTALTRFVREWNPRRDSEASLVLALLMLDRMSVAELDPGQPNPSRLPTPSLTPSTHVHSVACDDVQDRKPYDSDHRRKHHLHHHQDRVAATAKVTRAASRIKDTREAAHEAVVQLRGAGIIGVLQELLICRCSEASVARQLARPLLERFLQVHLAFWMGQHPRLGAKSVVQVRLIIFSALVYIYAYIHITHYIVYRKSGIRIHIELRLKPTIITRRRFTGL